MSEDGSLFLSPSTTLTPSEPPPPPETNSLFEASPSTTNTLSRDERLAACSRADIIQKGAARKVILVQRRHVYYNFHVRENFAELFRPLPQREEKMSENENITSPGVPESESGSASLSEESAAVPCSSADDATFSAAPLAEGGGAEEEGAGAPEEEAEKGPETYIVTAEGGDA